MREESAGLVVGLVTVVSLFVELSVEKGTKEPLAQQTICNALERG